MVWLSVCIHLMNQNVYPAHSEDVLAALPIRATRGLMNANYTAFFTPKPRTRCAPSAWPHDTLGITL
jgi:hypothetical protein